LTIASTRGITTDEKEAKVRNFALRYKDGNEIVIFTDDEFYQSYLFSFTLALISSSTSSGPVPKVSRRPYSSMPRNDKDLFLKR
jgi:hypothetical protein